MIIVTNNQQVYTKYKGRYAVDYSPCSFEEVLIKARDKVHAGHEIYTHPLSSSIKPNETPYKSIILSKDAKQLHYPSLKIIEESIGACKKFQKGGLLYKKEHNKDYEWMDLSVLESALNNINI